MVNQVHDDQNIRVIDTNNGLADKNGLTDNAGNPDHNTLPGGSNPGPSVHRDGVTASSSSVPPPLEEDNAAPISLRAAQFQEVSVPAGADAITRALFTAISQTNYLIFAQGERLRALEDDRRPARRHRRPQTPPPRVTEVHFPSPPRRHYRDTSRSPSP